MKLIWDKKMAPPKGCKGLIIKVRGLLRPGNPETAIFRNFCVNLQVCWFGERVFASAQPFGFLDLAKNISFPNLKLH
jgi:hypothetical protein